MGRRHSDPAWKHCTMINGKSNHVKCNYCRHSMWGGVSRLKEHLAKKRGDVIPCGSCPPEVATKMMDLLIEQALAKEEKHRHKRESLEKLKHVEVELAMNDVDEDRDENECLDRAIKESLSTYEMEKKMAAMDNDVYEVACRESLRFYEMEKKLRGYHEGCSSSGPNKAGPSHAKYDFSGDLGIDDEFASDYDSDLGF